ncbi:glycosyltransferase family 4 protein [Polycladidibacter stylochi]|uniref:glycosyltransferase family 4 protein n=1 Tax=Polycladidibacter stylochi TaxID=1807766 RepID=UPI0008361EB2|nr:glycosyltransferase family 4 protein [Pseudovibrio stylochi]
MHFTEEGATSIDLCARDFIQNSNYKDTTTVFCGAEAQYFAGFNCIPYPVGKRAQLAVQLKKAQPDVIVVHQRVALAAYLARKLPDTPVIVHRHNFVKPKRMWLKRFLVGVRYRNLAAVVFVSNACKDHFEKHWPQIKTPRYVVHNGLDFSQWQAQSQKQKSVLFAGRMSPDKGVLELAQAASLFLPQHPDWTLRLICACQEKDREYRERVFTALEPVKDQVDYQENLPFEKVKQAYEQAAIALVPSKFEEPFGRTAIEAFAGGAALITSGTGGLREVCGDNVLYLENLEPETIARNTLILMENDQVRVGLAQAGRNHALKHYPIKSLSEKLDVIIEGCVA